MSAPSAALKEKSACKRANGTGSSSRVLFLSDPLQCGGILGRLFYRGALRTLAPNGAMPTDNEHPKPDARSALVPSSQK